jgi:hypothetical protein
MLNYNLLKDEGILMLTPTGALEESDFAAESFPGWNDFGAFIPHMRFIRDHHRHIRKVAAVSDSAILAIGPRIASHFVNAEVRHFESADRGAALDWIRESPEEGAGPLD